MVVSAMALPPRQCEIHAWARDFGLAHELGGYRRAYKAARHSSRKGLGIFITGLGLLPGIAVASAAAGQARPIMFGVVGIIVALGVALIRTAPSEKADWIFRYAGGLVQVVDGDVGPRVVPWSLLGQVLKDYSRGTADTDPSLQTIRVTGRDGTEITAGAKEYRWIGQLERDIDQVVAERRFPAAIEQYRSGAPVPFGSLSVSPDSIAWAHGLHQAAWPDIRSVRVSEHAIEFTTRAPRRRRQVALADIPDSRVAVMLIQEAAAMLRIPLEGGCPAAPLSPPAARRITVAGTELLSPAEVSQAFGWPMEAATGPAAARPAARFQDGGAALSLTVRNRSALDTPITRRLGRAVPGFDHEAWLLNRDRSVVVLADTVTAKLDLDGLPRSARAAVLKPLARIVAARLAGLPAGSTQLDGVLSTQDDG